MRERPPEKEPGRNALSQQIKKVRAGEWGVKFYKIDRSMSGYILSIGGLRHLLDYVRQRGGSRVLDIGAGTTRGVAELAKSPLGRDLQFEATVMSYHPVIEKNLGGDHTHVTAGETLRGVADNSVDCIIANHSIAYSIDPERVVRSIDRILKPGGVIKGIFGTGGKTDPKLKAKGYGPVTPFADALNKLGFAVALHEVQPDDDGNTSSIMIAIKPSGDIPRASMIATARSLYESDDRDASADAAQFRGDEPSVPVRGYGELGEKSE